jgi:hypothetical protein
MKTSGTKQFALLSLYSMYTSSLLTVRHAKFIVKMPKTRRHMKDKTRAEGRWANPLLRVSVRIVDDGREHTAPKSERKLQTKELSVQTLLSQKWTGCA